MAKRLNSKKQTINIDKVSIPDIPEITISDGRVYLPTSTKGYSLNSRRGKQLVKIKTNLEKGDVKSATKTFKSFEKTHKDDTAGRSARATNKATKKRIDSYMDDSNKYSSLLKNKYGDEIAKKVSNLKEKIRKAKTEYTKNSEMAELENDIEKFADDAVNIIDKATEQYNDGTPDGNKKLEEARAQMLKYIEHEVDLMRKGLETAKENQDTMREDFSISKTVYNSKNKFKRY